jgi:hypothetical protein
MGKQVLLQPRLYTYFQKLWWGMKSGNPWIRKDTLEPGLNQAKYISKLRRVFREQRLNIKIVSDGAGRYRLLLPEGEDRAIVAGND